MPPEDSWPFVWLRGRVLLRRHAQRPVQANHFAVEHRVFDDVFGQRRVFRRIAEPWRERDLRAERFPHVFRQPGEQRSVEQARRDGYDADAQAGEVAGDRQRHSDDPAFRRRIRRLADLAVEGRDRGRVDDHAAFAPGVRLLRRHSRRGESDDVESSDQIDLNDSFERRERMRSFLADGPLGDADAGAIDRAAQNAEGGDGRAHRALDALFIGYVCLDEAGVRAERPGERLALLLVDVGDDDVCAALREQLRGRSAQARRSARYQKSISADFHYWRLLVFFILSKRVDRSYPLTLALYTLRSQRGKASSVFAP